jgi:hypothetical protein
LSSDIGYEFMQSAGLKKWFPAAYGNAFDIGGVDNGFGEVCCFRIIAAVKRLGIFGNAAGAPL